MFIFKLFVHHLIISFESLPTLPSTHAGCRTTFRSLELRHCNTDRIRLVVLFPAVSF